MPLRGVHDVLSLLEAGISLEDLLTLLALCSARVYAAMMVLPATNDQVIQGVVRNAIALTMGVFVALGQPVHILASLSPLDLAMMAFKEALVGVLIGFAASTVFWIAETVGMLIDNVAGYNFVQQNNPLSGQTSTPIGNMMHQLVVTAFYMLGGMTVFIGLLLDSHAWWPMSATMPNWTVLSDRFFSSTLTEMSEASLKLAGPVLVTLTLIDLGIGLLTKAADKLDPSSLGQPIKAAVAIGMVLVLVTVFFDQVRNELTLRTQAKQLERLGKATSVKAPESKSHGR
ncbi:MAG TPA: type III secretion system export apparatus subunit SctT [Burkholderiaceae bacterium]|nr:type III secretion system export apparatus subunit SctT [Burkholderiaceae bacterium]